MGPRVIDLSGWDGAEVSARRIVAALRRDGVPATYFPPDRCGGGRIVAIDGGVARAYYAPDRGTDGGR